MAKISIIPWIVKKLKRCIGIVEDTDTASQAIASNKYVIWKGDICKSTSAISEGDTLSSSNLSPVTGGVGNDLSQGIANLEDSFTPVKITPVAQENVSLIDHCVYTVGNMAFVNLSFSLSAAPTSTQQFVLNLPKPKANVPITAHKNLGGGNYQAFLSTAGAIRNDYDGFANGGKYFVSCAYAI